ncbi:MAG: hypothetical protein E6J71_25805 [Deltaproteobacteria bacterium]|nr:MAG: hypothetical protein E6J71_25805 [Deltaproteobacteria bacterium]
MMLSPGATDTPAASVIVMLETLLPVFVPMFLTKAMLACASDAARVSRTVSASVAMARRAGSVERRIVRLMRAIVLLSSLQMLPAVEWERSPPHPK